MSEPLRLALAAGTAWAATLLTVPIAIWIARATHFLDRPVGYKGHRRATPYLGGAAVMVAFAAGAIAFGGAIRQFGTLMFCAAALLVVGTVDDRLGLGVLIRLGVQLGVAVALWGNGLGWHLFASGTLNLAITIVWVVGLINAFNLFDNLDGATATVGAVSAAGIAAVALSNQQAILAALALALSGACVGFLRFNLARPSRIFLGDGGSMPIGALIAGMVMLLERSTGAWSGLLALVPLVGLPILDTTLVVLSRWRRGARILVGHRDHLTHRLFSRLGSQRRVAFTLAVSQGLLCTVALVLDHSSREAIYSAAAAYLIVALAVLSELETANWTRAIREAEATAAARSPVDVAARGGAAIQEETA